MQLNFINQNSIHNWDESDATLPPVALALLGSVLIEYQKLRSSMLLFAWGLLNSTVGSNNATNDEIYPWGMLCFKEALISHPDWRHLYS